MTRDDLKMLTREQLEVMVYNGELIIGEYGHKLGLLTGCEFFGDADGMDGECYDCSLNNPQLHNRCLIFRKAFVEYVKSKLKND